MLVDQKVKTGRYNSTSEVVSEALRLLEQQDILKELQREELRKEIMKGVDDINAGRYVTLETDEDFASLAEHIKQEGRKRLEERKNAK